MKSKKTDLVAVAGLVPILIFQIFLTHFLETDSASITRTLQHLFYGYVSFSS